jgi:hypothetical protein
LLSSHHISRSSSISEYVFHHLLLWDTCIPSTNELGALNLSDRLAWLEIFAALSLGIGSVWSTRLSNHIALFEKECIQDWLSALAPLLHEVTLKHLLRGDRLNLFTISQFESRIDSLGERNCVATTTSALIQNVTCKVISPDVSEVVVLRNFTIWDILSIRVLLLPLLGELEGFHKFFIAHVSKLLVFFSHALIGHKKCRFTIFTLSISRVRFLK